MQLTLGIKNHFYCCLSLFFLFLSRSPPSLPSISLFHSFFLSHKHKCKIENKIYVGERTFQTIEQQVWLVVFTEFSIVKNYSALFKPYSLFCITFDCVMGLRLHIVMRRPLFLISPSKSQIYLTRTKWTEKFFWYNMAN